ncbi:MAG: bioY family protein [Gammaproteobacteria bacterium]|jgi:biotin transport system substrate-specific component|nr:bioY family protein [Gammaproteobacteria bacterium]
MSVLKSTLQTHVGAKEGIKVLLGVLLLFACSQIFIPLDPVPITLQTVAVMTIGVLYRNLSTALMAVVGYILLGVAGVPLFAGYLSGFHILAGSTGGYLLGFIPCVYLMNKIGASAHADSALILFLRCLLGTVVVYICGVSWLSFYVGAIAAIQLGLVPFIIPGVIKALLLVAILKSLGLLNKKISKK